LLVDMVASLVGTAVPAAGTVRAAAVEAGALAAAPMEAAEVEAPVGAVALTEAGVEVPVQGAGAEEVVVAAVAITKDH
jgi:hypothetical protein